MLVEEPDECSEFLFYEKLILLFKKCFCIEKLYPDPGLVNLKENPS